MDKAALEGLEIPPCIVSLNGLEDGNLKLISQSAIFEKERRVVTLTHKRLPISIVSYAIGCPVVDPSIGGAWIFNGGTGTIVLILATPVLPSPLLYKGWMIVTVVGLPWSNGGIQRATDLKLGCVRRKESRQVKDPLKRESKKSAELKVKSILSRAVSFSTNVSALISQYRIHIDGDRPPF